MLRRETLLRMHETLLQRRANLCKELADELAIQHDFEEANATDDNPNRARAPGGVTTASRLAELDARAFVS